MVPGPQVTVGGSSFTVFSSAGGIQLLQPDSAKVPKETAATAINDKLLMAILPKR